LNEMVRSVQAIARVVEPHSEAMSKRQRRRMVVEIPVSRSGAARMGLRQGSGRDELTPYNEMEQRTSNNAVSAGSGSGSSSSRAAASAAMGARSRRSETPVVRARAKRLPVDLGL
jgi:hypothetical protein